MLMDFASCSNGDCYVSTTLSQDVYEYKITTQIRSYLYNEKYNHS